MPSISIETQAADDDDGWRSTPFPFPRTSVQSIEVHRLDDLSPVPLVNEIFGLSIINNIYDLMSVTNNVGSIWIDMDDNDPEVGVIVVRARADETVPPLVVKITYDEDILK